MGHSVKGLTEDQEDNIHYATLIDQAVHFIIKACQAGQAGLSFGELLMTTGNFLLLPVLL